MSSKDIARDIVEDILDGVFPETAASRASKGQMSPHKAEMAAITVEGTFICPAHFPRLQSLFTFLSVNLDSDALDLAITFAKCPDFAHCNYYHHS